MTRGQALGQHQPIETDPSSVQLLPPSRSPSQCPCEVKAVFCPPPPPNLVEQFWPQAREYLCPLFLKVKDFLGMLISTQAASRPHVNTQTTAFRSPFVQRKREQRHWRAVNTGLVSPSRESLPFYSLPLLTHLMVYGCTHQMPPGCLLCTREPQGSGTGPIYRTPNS